MQVNTSPNQQNIKWHTIFCHKQKSSWLQHWLFSFAVLWVFNDVRPREKGGEGMQRKLIGSFFILMVLLIIGSTSEKVQASPTSSKSLFLIAHFNCQPFEDVGEACT
ncbi:hypothetical protein HJ134_24110, partial [Vibrio parahaemolyticus]|nr:hypothetical protein [Vibrio parahaemolyticus]